ncbi:GNAT family N-acetyltransferase [Plantibacter sp. Mn2098]|uniref:GNAT family N-acetyltransferase n=1 Tax=Plantibacter sp. Mn2098 TaxID=3395266 RepID=UPI003BC5AB90
MSDVNLVRPAVASDVDGIAAVHVQGWRETYGSILPAAALAGLDVQAYADRWSQIIEAGATGVWVATAGDDIVGWASSSTGRDEVRPHDLELEGIYVLASHHGSGAGQQLLDAAVGGLGAYLWMAAANRRAQSFYRRNGFVPDGVEHVRTLLGTPVDVIRLTRGGDERHA